jgi:protein TonB
MVGYRAINRIAARRLSAVVWFTIFFLQAAPQPSAPLRELPRVDRLASVAYPGQFDATSPEPLPREWRQAVRAGIPSPVKTRHVNPVYPESARQDRIEGVVLLEVLIDEGGAVDDARVLRSIRLLDQAALDAVRQWRFTPSFVDNEPVKVILTVSVSFELRG